MKARDYRLTGTEALASREKGLAGAQWYTSPVSRKTLKELMKRRDGPAMRDTLIWFFALGISGGAGYWLWGTLWAVPAFLVYGVLYGTASDSRWHECGHGTAFRSRWMNEAVYQIACFMRMKEPTIWKWSHTRHHTDTIIVGQDPEIAVKRPPDILGILLNLFYIKNGWTASRLLIIHAVGRLTAEEKTFVPEQERDKVAFVARVHLAIHGTTIAVSVGLGSLLPLMFVGLPLFYGAWLQTLFGLTQHAGLDEDVLDHRLNSRTVYMNPVFRFLYLNMNYHVEHHMFPMVPYYSLPALHEEIKADCPKSYGSLFEAFQEIVPALMKQRKNPNYFVQRELPPRARTWPLPALAAE